MLRIDEPTHEELATIILLFVRDAQSIQYNASAGDIVLREPKAGYPKIEGKPSKESVVVKGCGEGEESRRFYFSQMASLVRIGDVLEIVLTNGTSRTLTRTRRG